MSAVTFRPMLASDADGFLDEDVFAECFHARAGAEFAEHSTRPPFGGAPLPQWRRVWHDPARLLAHA